MAEWFYRIMGEEIGPLTTGELRQRAKAAELLPETEVRKSGTDRWVWASQLKGLFDDPALDGSQSSYPKEDLPQAEIIGHTPTSEIIITTCDLKQPYEVLLPIYFQVSNKGIFSNKLRKLKDHYQQELSQRITHEPSPTLGAFVDFLFGPNSVGESDFEQAFYISMLEMKRIAASVNADAIIGMRQDTDLDTTGFQFFYMQTYGTAVKLIR